MLILFIVVFIAIVIVFMLMMWGLSFSRYKKRRISCCQTGHSAVSNPHHTNSCGCCCDDSGCDEKT